jgi:hypothetical protein
MLNWVLGEPRLKLFRASINLGVNLHLPKYVQRRLDILQEEPRYSIHGYFGKCKFTPRFIDARGLGHSVGVEF